MCNSADIPLTIYFVIGFLVYADEVRQHRKIKDMIWALLSLMVAGAYVYIIWNDL